jgi:hypothetical protein
MTKKIIRPEKIIEPEKKEIKKLSTVKNIHIEFISPERHIMDSNFTYNKIGIKQKISDTIKYNKIGFKMIYLYLKRFYLQTKIFFLKKWVVYSKFCYSINIDFSHLSFDKLKE